MRPHKPTVRSKAAALGRAKRLMVADLGWLRGFPEGLGPDGKLNWAVWPELGRETEASSVTVDRPLLQRAVQTRDQLYRRFPRALPRLVGDRDEWYDEITTRLEILKTTVHEGRPLPSTRALARTICPGEARRVATLATGDSFLQTLIPAIIWMNLSAPRRRDVMGLLAEHRGDIRYIRDAFGAARARHLILRLCDLRLAVGERPTAFLWHLLADPEIAALSFGGRSLLRSLSAPIPEADLELLDISVSTLSFAKPLAAAIAKGSLEVDWQDSGCRVRDVFAHVIDTLVQIPLPSVGLVLRLARLLAPRDIARRWRAYWQRVHRMQREAAVILLSTGPYLGRAERRKLTSLHDRLQRAENRHPPFYPAHFLPAVIREESTDPLGGKRRPRLIADCLARLPEVCGSVSVRIALIRSWQHERREYREYNKDERRFRALMSEASRFVIGKKNAGLALFPWENPVLEGQEGLLCREVNKLISPRNYYTALEIAYNRDIESGGRPCHMSEWEILIALLRNGATPHTAVDCLSGLIRANLTDKASVCFPALPFLLDLCDRSTEKLVEVETLVAREWYDDGAWDLTRPFAFLEKGAPLRESLATIDPSSFYEQVQAALAPRGLDPITLPRILAIPQLDERPELVLPLLRAVPPEPPLDAPTRLRAACLLRRAGAVTEAAGVLRALTRRQVDLRVLEDNHKLPCLAEHLTEVGLPSLALRVLKKTRPNELTYLPYTEPWLLAMARVHDKLYHRKLALDYYRRAAAESGDSPEYRPRIAELEALLEGEKGP